MHAVNEVNTAVRSWDSAVARGAASIATSTPSQPQAAPSPLQWDAAYRAADRLASAATPLYSQLFVPISQAPDGEWHGKKEQSAGRGVVARQAGGCF